MNNGHAAYPYSHCSFNIYMCVSNNTASFTDACFCECDLPISFKIDN